MDWFEDFKAFKIASIFVFSKYHFRKFVSLEILSKYPNTHVYFHAEQRLSKEAMKWNVTS